MNQVWNIARKELSDGLRNRWLLAISLLFAVLAVGIAWLGAAASGQLGFTSIPATIASLASLATFLMLLLTYPLGRGEILLGKFVGHGLILALAVLIGFGCAALAIAVLVEGVELGMLFWAFGRFMISSTLLGWVFLAFAYVLSGKVNEKSSAAGLALGVWFLFVLVFDLVLLALLVLSEGKFNPELLPWLLLLNPTDIYRLINLSGFEGSGSAMGVLSLGADLPVPASVLWLCLLAWIGVSLLLAYGIFRRRLT